MKPFDRCLAYLEKLPPSVSGSGGHDATLRAACEIVRFGLSPAEEWQALEWYNANRCSPVWSEKELRHKLADAHRKAAHGERLRTTNASAPRQKPITAAELTRLTAGRPAGALAQKLAASITPPPPANRQITGPANTSPAVASIGTLDAEIDRLHLAWKADPDPAHEAEHMRRMGRALIVAGWPYYADDGRDLGAAGWCQWAGLPIAEIHRLPITPPEVANTQAVSANDDGEYWQFVLAHEAEALAFAAQASPR